MKIIKVRCFRSSTKLVWCKVEPNQAIKNKYHSSLMKPKQLKLSQSTFQKRLMIKTRNLKPTQLNQIHPTNNNLKFQIQPKSSKINLQRICAWNISPSRSSWHVNNLYAKNVFPSTSPIYKRSLKIVIKSQPSNEWTLQDYLEWIRLP